MKIDSSQDVSMRPPDRALTRMNSSELVVHFQDRLQDAVSRIREQHQAGESPEKIVRSMTDLADETITSLSITIIEQVKSRALVWQDDGFSLVALGGYGRRELFPHSDIDLMMLYREGANKGVLAFARRMLQILWDLGYHVGHSTRTLRDCLEIARGDLTTRAAFMESRLLFGSHDLFKAFQNRFWSKVGHRAPAEFIRTKLAERYAEYDRYGSTVYLLQPDIKKSKGGLRDLNLMKWIAAARYETTDLDTLLQEGRITQQEHQVLRGAQDFLWRVRTELHFHAGRCQDVLSFQEQLRLANLFRFRDEPSLLGVERFMREYYRHSTLVHEIGMRFIDRARPRSFTRRFSERFNRRRLEGLFALTRYEISVDEVGRTEFFRAPESLLRLFQLSQQHGVPISQGTLALIHGRQDALSMLAWNGPAAGSAFTQILSRPGRILECLKLLHGLNILERIIPEYEHVHYLMQFNEYHKYTIDEHCIRAVGNAEALLSDPGPLGREYRDVRRKDILHLALLLHDVGKGREGDHSIIGGQIAVRVADRLRLGAEEKQLLVFLVENHLLMAHTAFRRDLSDDAVLLRFARAVANPETLRKLYVLTYADIAAVGPDTWTPWKRDLIRDLFVKTMEVLTGAAEELTQEQRGERVREELRHRFVGQFPADWLERQLKEMTPRYLMSTPIERIGVHLGRMDSLQTTRVRVDAEYRSEYKTSEYTVYTFDNLVPGIFCKIAGAMAARGLQILGAEIHTRRDGVVVDTFQVMDPDYNGEPPAHRFEEVVASIEEVLLGEREVGELIRRSARFPFKQWRPPRFESTRVEINNDISEKYTVLDVFAHDRQGLLYVITKAIFDLALSVHFAKVATRLDQVVDVFYVTDLQGKKIEDPERMQSIRQTLAAKVDEFLLSADEGERPVSA